MICEVQNNFSQRNQRLLQLSCIRFHFLHRCCRLIEQIRSRSTDRAIRVSHRSKRFNKFLIPILCHRTKSRRRQVKRLLLVCTAGNILNNRVDYVLLVRLSVLPRFKKPLCLFAVGRYRVLNRSVCQAGRHLINSVIYLVQVIRAALQTILQKLKIFLRRITSLSKLTRIFA